jgi:chromosome segregation ATPase
MADDEETNCARDHDSLVDLRARFEEFRVSLDDRLRTRDLVLENRLEKLNELREQVSEDRSAYVRTETFQASVREVDVRMEERDKTIERIQNWESKLIGVAAALIALAGLVGAFIGYIIKLSR